MKDASSNIVTLTNVLLKSDGFERIVFGEVFAPMRVDTYVDVMTPEEVKKSAYNFMRHMRLNKIDVMHNLEESGSYVVESFIVRHDGDPDGFLKGAWVLGVKVEDDALWNRIVSGEINGFSLYGFCQRDSSQEKTRVKVERVTEVIGVTDVSFEGVFPEHSHDFDIKFDLEDRIIPTRTSEVYGHTHDIFQATATEESYKHSHRYSMME